jgi:DNA-directed RNA polymerase specialized sigma24 family protein
MDNTAEAREVGDEATRQYEDWEAVLTTCIDGLPEARSVAFLKLKRLLQGFLRRIDGYLGQQRAGALWFSTEEWEDFFQDTTVTMWKKLTQGELREPDAFVSYSFRTTWTAVSAVLRQKRSIYIM